MYYIFLIKNINKMQKTDILESLIDEKDRILIDLENLKRNWKLYCYRINMLVLTIFMSIEPSFFLKSKNNGLLYDFILNSLLFLLFLADKHTQTKYIFLVEIILHLSSIIQIIAGNYEIIINFSMLYHAISCFCACKYFMNFHIYHHKLSKLNSDDFSIEENYS